MKQTHTIRQLYRLAASGQLTEKTSVILSGWIRTNRLNGAIGFIELNDGSYFKNTQLVYHQASLTGFDNISKFGTGTAITMQGVVQLTPAT